MLIHVATKSDIQHPPFSSRKLWSRQFSFWDLSSCSPALAPCIIFLPAANFSHFNVNLSFVVRYLCCRMTLSQTEHWAVDRVCFGRLRVVRVKQHQSCEPWATQRRRGRVPTEEPRRNFQAGYRADLRTLGEKNESKGGRKWNTSVVIGAGEACDGSGVAGDRQRQPLVQLVHWCSRRSLENVCLGILLHTGLLSSAEDSPRCVTRVQAQIEFWDIQQQQRMISKMSKVRFISLCTMYKNCKITKPVKRNLENTLAHSISC